MNDGAIALGAGISILLVIFGIVLAVLWLILPFAIFGIKERLDTLIIEVRRTNEFLRAGTPSAHHEGRSVAEQSPANMDEVQEIEEEQEPSNHCVICNAVPDKSCEIWVGGKKRVVCLHHEFEAVPKHGICPVCGSKLRGMHEKRRERVLIGENAYEISAHAACGNQLLEILRASDPQALVKE